MPYGRAGANDDQFLFLQQIGVRWVHVQFPLNADFDMLKNTHDRLARYGIKIHQGIIEQIRHRQIVAADKIKVHSF